MTTSPMRTLVAFTLSAATTVAFTQATLPQPKTEGNVRYLNGGAGSEEVDFIKSSMKDYSLALAFSRGSGEYVASVSITVLDAKGGTVFEEPSVGPYLLVQLPAGKYSVVANYGGVSKTRPVTVGSKASSLTVFRWN